MWLFGDQCNVHTIVLFFRSQSVGSTPWTVVPQHDEMVGSSIHVNIEACLWYNNLKSSFSNSNLQLYYSRTWESHWLCSTHVGPALHHPHHCIVVLKPCYLSAPQSWRGYYMDIINPFSSWRSHCPHFYAVTQTKWKEKKKLRTWGRRGWGILSCQ